MRRPNFLILYTDQHRWDALGCNGNPEIHTPEIDALAAHGVTFTHHFVQHPLCMPSRVSRLTGQNPSKLGITAMGVPVPETSITLPRLLRPYGYTCANLGKLHFLPHANRDHREAHPDHPSGPGPRDDFSGARPFPAPDDLTHSAFVAQRTIDFLNTRTTDAAPFLCIAGFYSPHAPWITPQRFLDLYQRDQLSLPRYPEAVDARRPADPQAHFSDAQLRSAKHGYFAMISEVDFYVGRILAALRNRDLAENTIVIFTADHGEWLGDHLRFGKGYPGDDAATRVPLVMQGPGCTPGRVSDALVESVDLVPTLLDLAAIQPPPHLQGRARTALLRGETEPAAPEAEPCALFEADGWRSIRTARYRYLIHADGREFLWDLDTDPGEYHSVAHEHTYAETVFSCRKLLLTKLLSIERPLPRTWPY
jgi:arylsulfatase A-like enzyme